MYPNANVMKTVSERLDPLSIQQVHDLQLQMANLSCHGKKTRKKHGDHDEMLIVALTMYARCRLRVECFPSTRYHKHYPEPN